MEVAFVVVFYGGGLCLAVDFYRLMMMMILHIVRLSCKPNYLSNLSQWLIVSIVAD